MAIGRPAQAKKNAAAAKKKAAAARKKRNASPLYRGLVKMVNPPKKKK